MIENDIARTLHVAPAHTSSGTALLGGSLFVLVSEQVLSSKPTTLSPIPDRQPPSNLRTDALALMHGLPVASPAQTGFSLGWDKCFYSSYARLESESVGSEEKRPLRQEYYLRKSPGVIPETG